MPGPVVPNQALLNGINPLAYMGVRPTSPSLYLIETKDPSTIDKNYPLGTWWLNNNSPYRLWRLANLNAGVATWIMVSASSGTLATLTSNTGGAVPPDVNGNIFVVGDGTTITGAGNAGTNTITFSLIGGESAVDSLTGNSGGAVHSDINGNINVIGSTANNITIVGTPMSNTLTAALTGTTNHSVQVGNAAGSLNSITNGTTGQFLTAVTGANPIWTTGTLTAPPTEFVIQLAQETNVTGDGTNYKVGTNAAGTTIINLGGDLTGGGGGNPYTYTAPVTGLYSFASEITMQAGDPASNTVSGNYGGTSPIVWGLGVETTTSTGRSSLTGAGLIYLVAGETIQWNVQAAGGAKTTQVFGGWIGGALLAGPGGNLTTLHTQDGHDVTATGGTINVSGSHGINTTGTIGPNTVTVSLNNTITVGDLVNVPAGSNSITMTSGDLLLNGNSGVMSAEGIAKIKFAPAATGQPTNDIYFYLNSIFIGNSTGNQTATPSVALFNIGIGGLSLRALTTGTRNIAIAQGVLQACTTGQSNTAIGDINLNILTTGSNNTIVGSSCLEFLLTGSNNTVYGFNNGDNYTSSESSNIVIGSNIPGTVGESNALRIGLSTGTGASQINKTFIAGITGITTGGAAVPVLVDANGQLGTTSSSIRYKENIAPLGSYSEDIYKLNPVVFNYKTHSPELKSFGLIAEEVEQVMPDLVIYNKDGEVETVKYHEMVPILLNEIIKLNQRILDLEKRS